VVDKNGYICRSCGQYHEGIPLSYAADAPELWYLIPEKERSKRVKRSSDVCVIDRKHHFILDNIEIPILDAEGIFVWSVWVSLSEVNFKRSQKLLHKCGREKEPPYFGWLSTQLPCYPDTINLKTLVHTRPVGQKPLIELEPGGHPLAVEQRKGIPWQRVQEIAGLALHGESPETPNP
jgi:hypothetical protein